MGESELVASTGGRPATVATLAADLERLGVRPGSAMLVHSSLRSLGWVVGGAQAVIEALERTLGNDGTLAMPAFSLAAPEPSRWVNPPVPQAWWPTIRAEWPAFDVDLTPTRGVGTIPETFRKQRGTLRSHHPDSSVCARGPRAAEIVSRHELADGFGDGSPLGRLYDADAFVLLLGVGHDRNSSLHLSEYRADWPGRRDRIERVGRVVEDGAVVERRWTEYEARSDDFAELGAAFERAGDFVRLGPVGGATARLTRQRPLVDFGTSWLSTHRAPADGPPTPRTAPPTARAKVR